MCEHEVFYAETTVNRLLTDDDRVTFQADLQIWCQECGKQLQFMGLPLGVNFTGPSMSVDRKEARLAIEICDASPKIQ